jgi:glutaredoxin
MSAANQSMPDLSTRILALFDDLKRDSLDLHAFFEMAGSKSPDHQAEVLDAVAELVGIGLLKPGDGGDFYTRTEDGRLRLAGARDVTLYSREGCHLCEAARAEIMPLAKAAGARFTEVDIDKDPDLRQRYDQLVPVVLIGKKEVSRERFDLANFRKQLQDTKR